MRKSQNVNLTIGEALDQLKQLPLQAKIKIDSAGIEGYFKNYGEEEEREQELSLVYFTGDYDSYRGYYEDLSIEISSEPKDFTVANMTELLNKALRQGTMFGYKGGDFSINNDTILWLDTYGRARGIGVIKFFKVDENNVLLITKYIE